MNRVRATIFILAAIFISFFLSRDALARFFWQKNGDARLAYFLNFSDADLAIQLGNYYFGNTAGKSEYNLKLAEKSFKKAVKIKDDILWGHYQLARIYFMNKDFDKALSEINKELEFNPGNVRSFYIRGLIFAYRGDFLKSEEDFKNFVMLMPKEWAGYNDLAWVLAEQKKYQEAERVLVSAGREVLDADKNPWLLNGLGAARLNLKKYSTAAVSLERALKFAEELTERDWGRAYPGNDPRDAAGGLSQFVAAIKSNLAKAKNGAVDNGR